MKLRIARLWQVYYCCHLGCSWLLKIGFFTFSLSFIAGMHSIRLELCTLWSTVPFHMWFYASSHRLLHYWVLRPVCALGYSCTDLAQWHCCALGNSCNNVSWGHCATVCFTNYLFFHFCTTVCFYSGSSHSSVKNTNKIKCGSLNSNRWIFSPSRWTLE
jgi:hypothetical protein